MSRLFLTSINLNQNELQNGVLQNLGTAPATPKAGQVYYSTAVSCALVYNGTTWVTTDATKATGIPIAALAIDPTQRANHTGTQLASTISNLATTVQGYSLSSFALPTGPLAMGGFRLTGLGAPTQPTDAATLSSITSQSLSAFGLPTANIPMGGYTFTGLSQSPNAPGQAAEYSWVISQIQSAAAGISSKPPVACVAVTNQTLSGLPVIDGYQTVANDRVLLTGQTTASQNGPYNAATGAWTRTAVDGAGNGEIEPGALFLVVNGTTYSKSQWIVATTGAITVGTTSLSITQFAAAVTYTGSSTILLTGTAFSVVVAPGGGIIATASGLSLDTTVATRKYAATIGDGTATSFTVTHNLGTQDVQIQVRQASNPFGLVEADMSASTTTTATIAFNQAPASASMRVIVMG